MTCSVIFPPGQSSTPLISVQDSANPSTHPETITNSTNTISQQPKSGLSFATLVKSMSSLRTPKVAKSDQSHCHTSKITPTPDSNGNKPAQFYQNQQQDSNPAYLQPQDQESNHFDESSFQPDTETTRSHGKKFP